MQLIDAGMIAFAAWHALKKRMDHPLTFQVPRMLRKILQESGDTYALFWNDSTLWKEEMWPPFRAGAGVTMVGIPSTLSPVRARKSAT